MAKVGIKTAGIQYEEYRTNITAIDANLAAVTPIQAGQSATKIGVLCKINTPGGAPAVELVKGTIHGSDAYASDISPVVSVDQELIVEHTGGQFVIGVSALGTATDIDLYIRAI